ncbi:hypothetical protein H5410_062483 [Solanum commersonii]|uniref:ABC-2 type transporter transmembrane domain-containing protein n=1 Tax=Solanum commersonii TaxID=4109 RepID=A0A9J5WB06_SOLCO|nr:hypothetical protein H5410_062483 [Solanum commersonii]
MYTVVLFVGINNCSSVQAIFVVIGRTVFYQEKDDGMNSALPYAMAQYYPNYTYYTLIVYKIVGFELTSAKFFWFFIYGMMTISITPNHNVASIFAATFFSFFNLLSCFFIPRPRIPKWWILYYWICPMAWTLYGCIVSQYGDVEDTIKVPGMSSDPKIKDYIIDHFGYNPNFMGLVATVETNSDLTTIIGAMYTVVLFVGIDNCSTVQAIFVVVGRTVLY